MITFADPFGSLIEGFERGQDAQLEREQVFFQTRVQPALNAQERALDRALEIDILERRQAFQREESARAYSRQLAASRAQQAVTPNATGPAGRGVVDQLRFGQVAAPSGGFQLDPNAVEGSGFALERGSATPQTPNVAPDIDGTPLLGDIVGDVAAAVPPGAGRVGFPTATPVARAVALPNALAASVDAAGAPFGRSTDLAGNVTFTAPQVNVGQAAVDGARATAGAFDTFIDSLQVPSGRSGFETDADPVAAQLRATGGLGTPRRTSATTAPTIGQIANPDAGAGLEVFDIPNAAGAPFNAPINTAPLVAPSRDNGTFVTPNDGIAARLARQRAQVISEYQNGNISSTQLQLFFRELSRQAQRPRGTF